MLGFYMVFGNTERWYVLQGTLSVLHSIKELWGIAECLSITECCEVLPSIAGVKHCDQCILYCCSVLKSVVELWSIEEYLSIIECCKVSYYCVAKSSSLL